MTWAQIRGGIYLALLGMAIAAVYGLSVLGWATYDVATGMVDIHEFHLVTVVTYITTWIVSGLTAFVALFKRWRTR